MADGVMEAQGNLRFLGFSGSGFQGFRAQGLLQGLHVFVRGFRVWRVLASGLLRV